MTRVAVGVRSVVANETEAREAIDESDGRRWLRRGVPDHVFPQRVVESPYVVSYGEAREGE